MKAAGVAAAVVALAAALLLAAPPFAGGGEAAAASPLRVALTFDDGYNFDHRILDYLSSQGITATAFVIGSWAQNNPSLMHEMNALGWDICNHTQNHPWLTKLSDPQIVAELNTCQSVIGSMTGQYHPIFRPPGGFIDARVSATAASIGFAPVMWDFDSQDALNTNVPVPVRVGNMVSAARDGDILLFHFGGRNTIDLVTGVVRGLQQRGACFITMSELFGWRDQLRGGESGPGIAAAATRFFFAEGTTRPGFEEWLLVMNPGGGEVTLEARFFSPQGEHTQSFTISPRSRISIPVNDTVPWQDDVSVILDASAPVAAERMLYFTRGRGLNGGSLAPGTDAPSRLNYFPEGSVRPGFEEYLALFNPSSMVSAGVVVELHGGGGKAGEAAFTVPPLGRVTARVNDLVPEGDYSAVLRSSSPVVAERSEYFAYKDFLTGGHCVPGTAAPRGEHYFAEGTTRSTFDGYLTLYNPCNFSTWIKVRMIGSDGVVREEMVDLAAGDRATLNINAYLPPDIDYSIRLSSLLPVLAERASYFQSHNVMGGSCSPGCAAPQEHWLFPEGCTAQGFQEWLALFNPGEGESMVTVEFLPGGGEAVTRSYLLQPEARVTLDVAAEVGQVQEVSVAVTAPSGVVAERSVYFSKPAR